MSQTAHHKKVASMAMKAARSLGEQGGDLRNPAE